MNIYDIKILKQDGSETTLTQFKGKVLLIVNTATHCGYTKQYSELESLYKKYKDKGFEIIDFPCNQFAFQAPGSDEKINKFCSLKFGTTFTRFKKIKVNGKNASELYVFLKKNAFSNTEKKLNGKRISWNFTKFLVSKDGNKIIRYSGEITPFNMENNIKEFLADN